MVSRRRNNKLDQFNTIEAWRSFEAPGFYKKQGDDVAVTIDCDPPGVTRYYMMKKL